jgi:hypothetical protein
MKLSQRQKLMLFTICLDTLRIESPCFGINRDDRNRLCDEIVNQQDASFDSGVFSIPCINQEEK